MKFSSIWPFPIYFCCGPKCNDDKKIKYVNFLDCFIWSLFFPLFLVCVYHIFTPILLVGKAMIFIERRNTDLHLSQKKKKKNITKGQMWNKRKEKKNEKKNKKSVSNLPNWHRSNFIITFSCCFFVCFRFSYTVLCSFFFCCILFLCIFFLFYFHEVARLCFLLFRAT